MVAPPVIIIGLGEMGGVFARAFLRQGYPVQPILRGQDIIEISEKIPKPTLVLIAVGEADLQTTLAQIPPTWQASLALLQNELLPRDWQHHDLPQPTVISVWFEKKPGQDFKVIVPSPVYGPHASLMCDALAQLNIPCQALNTEAELLFELVRKNVYILTTNIAGLITGGTVASLWRQHQPLARGVAVDIIDLQNWLTRHTFDQEALIDAMVIAFNGDPEHRCMGRSAPARLANALRLAEEAELEAVTLRRIADETRAQ